MAHYFIYQEKVGAPFVALRELKMITPAGRERRQASRHPKLLLVLGGTVEIRMKGGFHAILRQGDGLIVPKPCHHYYTSPLEGKDSELYVFVMFLGSVARPRKPLSGWEAEWYRILADLFSDNRHLPSIMDASLYALIHAFREEYHSARPGTLVRQKNIAQDLVVELARRLSAPGAAGEASPARYRSHAFTVNDVKEFLVKTLDRRHTLSEIAWRFHLSEEHLARLFKKETGGSVMAFLRAIRVEAAQGYLLSSNETIAILAERLGFSSSNHFCRAFVALTGMRPMEYRKKYAGTNALILPLGQRLLPPKSGGKPKRRTRPGGNPRTAI
ncbi:MAG TPA: helix-turn-helix domain-containing protein [Chthoniobacteraceae bacterium]|nr:helix-turn-helix domain-containing protein [Chthoniobacteraceae bacterium]